MDLQWRIELASGYRAGPQIVRVLSEDWCTRELYCPACDSDELAPTPANTPTTDFVCPVCGQRFQLKSLKNWGVKKVVDAGYNAMLRAIHADQTPNLFLLHYSGSWCVRNLVLIPRVFFSKSVIEKRSPLGLQARRAGWVGCNILVSRIPDDGKIAMVSDGLAVPVQKVRREFTRIRGLAQLPPSLRGWTLDVLNAIRRLGKRQFSLQEVYGFEVTLRELHPHNQNVRPKIRQQLQVLRDMGLIEFTRPGEYAIRE